MKSITICLILITSWSLLISGQQKPEIVIQSGHSSKVISTISTPDSKFLISASTDNNIIVWDRKKNAQYRSFKIHNPGVSDILLNHKEPGTFYSCGLDGKIFLNDISNGTSELVTSIGSPIYKMHFNASNSKYYLGSSHLIICDKDFNQLSKIAPFTRNKPWGQNKHEIKDFDVTDDGKMCAITDHQDYNLVINLEELETFSLQTRRTECISFGSKDNRVLQGFSNGSVRFSGSNSMQSQLVITKDLDRKTCIEKYDNKHLVGSQSGKLYVVKQGILVALKTINSLKSGISSITYSNNLSEITVGCYDGNIYILDSESFDTKHSYSSKINRVGAVSLLNNDKAVACSFLNNQLEYFDLSTFKRISNDEFVNNHLNDRYETEVVGLFPFSDSIIQVQFLKKKRSLEIIGRYDYVREYSCYWDIYSNTIEAIKKVKEPAYSSFYKRGVFQGTTKQLSSQSKIYDYNLRAIQNHSFSSGNFDQLTSYIHNGINFYASASWNGDIKLWDKESGALSSKLYLLNDDQFVIFDNENHYYSSKNGIKNIGFLLNNKLYDFEQFDLIYNRPDLVFKPLSRIIGEEMLTNYVKATEKRLSRLGENLADQEIDLSEVPKIEQISANQNLNKVKLDLNWTSFTNENNHLHITVNGVPEFGEYGQSLLGQNGKVDLEILLESGQNKISIYVEDGNGLKSLRWSENFTHKSDKKPNLFVVTIGCSEYLESQYNLKYAHKDASDISRFMKRAKLFEEYQHISFENEQVTSKCLDNIKSFISKADLEDVVLVYVAGHGVLDEDYDLFLATHDLNFQNPKEKGIAFDHLETIIASSKSRHKYLFIDACHSGEIDKEDLALEKSESISEDLEIQFRNTSSQQLKSQSSFQMSQSMFANMKKNNGVSVISSSGGTEFSMEGNKWKNGVFTYSFINGLDSKKADINQDGRIMMSELTRYIQENVSQLTRGRQNPTSRIENLYNDVQIF